MPIVSTIQLTRTECDYLIYEFRSRRVLIRHFSIRISAHLPSSSIMTDFLEIFILQLFVSALLIPLFRTTFKRLQEVIRNRYDEMIFIKCLKW
jgi:hypothetical protein